jgi:uncharacterized membrane protein YqaE (UPF0057 family)
MAIDILKIVAAFLLPPLAVGLQVGVNDANFWLNMLLTFLGCWLPGVIHAICLILMDK